jgi:hypothetical protein
VDELAGLGLVWESVRIPQSHPAVFEKRDRTAVVVLERLFRRIVDEIPFYGGLIHLI